MLVPFKKYYISDAAVEEIPRPAPPDLYCFFSVINSDTLIREAFEPKTQTLPPYFDLTPFTSFQHFANSQISISELFPLSSFYVVFFPFFFDFLNFTLLLNNCYGLAF